MIITGIVEHGDARGRQLGFPTANIAFSDPGIDDGVWTAVVETGEAGWAAAAVSIGRRSTFYAQQGQRLLEAHLLDFDQDLYGQVLRIRLTGLLRRQQSFPSLADLVMQLREDVGATRTWAATNCPWLLAPTRRPSEVGA